MKLAIRLSGTGRQYPIEAKTGHELKTKLVEEYNSQMGDAPPFRVEQLALFVTRVREGLRKEFFIKDSFILTEHFKKGDSCLLYTSDAADE